MDRNFHAEASTIATQSDPNPDLELVDAAVYNLVIDHPDGTILWDTGCHPEAGDGHWPGGLYDAFPAIDAHQHRLDDDLAEAGYDIGEIDYVIQSHLHMDHAGGLEFFDGTDTPIFVHEAELKYAYFSAKTGEGNAGYVLDDFDHDLNWNVIYRDNVAPFEDIEFLHLPGHTPGLLGLRVELEDAGTLIFTSDLADSADNYERMQPMGPGLIWDRRSWFDSLRRIHDLERRTDAEVVFGHDTDQIEAVGDGWS
jgi:glyoxylase-like metal-dependent hydrolase (beta-lactamase superfamily II)